MEALENIETGRSIWGLIDLRSSNAVLDSVSTSSENGREIDTERIGLWFQ
jgi:hypothetical protein